MNNFEMEEIQEQIDFTPEHKKNTVYQNFFVSIDKEMVTNIEKYSKVVCIAMDTDSANLIQFAAKNINQYNINNYSAIIKDAVEYFLAENYHELYSKYLDSIENQNINSDIKPASEIGSVLIDADYKSTLYQN